jgi:sugar lactone lactonase YvrE
MRIQLRNGLCALLAVSLIVFLADAIAYADNIYVSCDGSGTIAKIDSSGNKSTFASGLNNPTGLAFDSWGNLWAAEGATGHNDGTIVKFDRTGHKSTFASGLNSPQGLAFDSGGNLYASSYGDGAIYKFDSRGNRSTFTSGLSWPEGLAFDSSGNLYVGLHGLYSLPSWYIGAISKYSPSGQQSWFAYWNNSTGIPMGLVFDSSNNLFMADHDALRIYKYDSSGNRTTFASGLNYPVGLAFDSCGNLYSTIEYDGTIMKFDSRGNGTIFASGLNEPLFIATQVPEPATLLLFALGGTLLRRRNK